MSKVLEQLNSVIEGAMRRKDQRSLDIYKTFKAGLIYAYGKDPSWDDAAKYAKNLISSFDKAVIQAAEHGQVFVPPEDEVEFLNEFIPRQLTETELRNYVSELVSLNKSITKGLVMKTLKAEFPNQYDGKVAAQIVGELLSNAQGS